MQTDTFLKIAQHSHDGAGSGAALHADALAADIVTGAKIRLDNDEYIRARNAGDTTNINIIKIDATDAIVLGAGFKNNTYLTTRNAADDGTINLIKVDGSDEIAFGADIAGLTLKHNTYLKADNAAAAATDVIKLDTNDEIAFGSDIANITMKHDTYIKADNAAASPTNVIKLDTNDEIAFGSDIANITMKHDTYIQADNAAASPTNLIKINTSDKMALGIDLANAAIVNNVALQHRNQADAAYIETLKVNTSDKIELGATVVAASIETATTSLIAPLDSAITLADNQSTTTTGIVTLTAGQSCTVQYKMIRNSVIQTGTLMFDYDDTLPIEEFHGTDLGITFTIATGVLNYASTSTGNTTSMTYIVTKGQ